VGGDAYFNRRFAAEGAVWLGGATITGQMICTGARLGKNGDNDSLFGDDMNVGRDLMLDNVRSSGAIRLNRAVISGQLSCDGGEYGANKSRRALTADQVTVRSHVNLSGITTQGGVVRMVRADILVVLSR
jgi:hypothetical protein